MKQNGNQRIRSAFAGRGRAALMPYFTLGYPDQATAIRVIEACCSSGADIMELGMPFSDPLADGPTIQASTQAAIQAGMNLKGCLESVVHLRNLGIGTPFILMGYVNPILQYGIKSFVHDSHAAGVDGFIIPDLPPEESGEFRSYCKAAGLGLIHLLAPNSPDERLDLVGAGSPPFIYLVSLMGVTGARRSLPDGLKAFIGRVRKRTEGSIPLAVGFGIANPDQAAVVGAEADGVIVGSALINIVHSALEAGKDPSAAAGGFVRGLSAAMADS